MAPRNDPVEQAGPGAALDEVTAMITHQLLAGKPLIAIGNGGSAAIAAHMAADLGRGGDGNACPPVKAMCPMMDPVTISMWANDVGWENAVAALIRPWLIDGALLVVISNSGMSANLVRAAQMAREVGCLIITISPRQDSQLARISDRLLRPRLESHPTWLSRVTSAEIAASRLVQTLCARVLASTGIRRELQRC